ncbi:hypothetical protein [Parapedobacter sp. 10938]|uniref:hypothetical protein n=1 Tax=Parapedobacter flavus TaxID=3110225 RepID=UPI002DBC56DF|nr:hypothetical protein [Parapedobacter sp. 10938]MEC3881125.1 hypothetical protein [Parapedobacter sp. 10938]
MAGVQHEDPTMMRSLSGTGTPVGEMHTEAPRLADGGHRRAYPILCSNPPSLTLPPGPIPICPAYISVKSPKSGTLAEGKRLHSGRKAHWGRERVGQGSDWGRAGDRFGSASGRLRR